MTVIASIRRLRDEFTTMPGLRLTARQVQRLCDVDASTSASALRALVSAGFLHELEEGNYRRTEMSIGVATRSTAGAVEPPWRRIVCLIEYEDDSYHSLTAASQSALAYAINLGVAHRARVTALHLVPSLPANATQQQAYVERLAEGVLRHAAAQTSPGLIDVHVAIGASNDDLLRSAGEIRADLIVLGRRNGGPAGLSRLREMLRDAPCHVLIVHPSGQAAVA
jgi:nucleotide-binding universal stress UspA family protein